MSSQRWAKLSRCSSRLRRARRRWIIRWAWRWPSLAGLQRRRARLKTASGLRPATQRFSVELAGVAFKQKNYPATIRELRRALRLSPGDTYANDFLGTTYFVEGNLEAALKYWNRVGKPQIAEVRAEPVPRLSPALLDHAFAFSPAATLTLPQLADSEARLRGLGVFPQFQFDLNARDDGSFDIVFRGRSATARARAGWKRCCFSLRAFRFKK